MMDAGRHPNIELMAYSEVEDISGYVGNFKVQVRRKARYVDESECTACGDCVPVCPVVRPDEFQAGLSTRRAIYIPFPQAVPSAYIVNADGAGLVQITDVEQNTRICHFDLSPDGTQVVYVEEPLGPAGVVHDVFVYRIDADGMAPLLLAVLPSWSSCRVRWSPDGEWVLVTTPCDNCHTDADLFLVKSDGSEVRHLFHTDVYLANARWLVDGWRIFFIVSNCDDDSNTLYTINSDGTGLEQVSRIVGLDDVISMGDFSPDQTQFVFTPSLPSEASRAGLYVLNLDTGYWTQILAGYQVVEITTWLPDPRQ